MNRSYLVAIFGLLGSLAYVMVAQKDPKVSKEVVHRPTPLPDRIILTWAGDPTTSQAVTWRTDSSVTKAVAEIAEAGDGPDFVTRAITYQAATEAFQSDLNNAQYHSVRFAQLKPATMYAYRVGDGFNWSEWNQFRTAEANRAPVEFLYVGDAQNDIYQLWSRLIRQGYSEAPKVRFIVHAGDLVNRGPSDSDWGEWHAAAGWINHSVVAFPTPGNHEYSSKQLTTHWRPQFTLPENGVKGLEETNYYVDIQGVRMVALNSNRMQQEQAEWLDKLLANNSNRWTVIAFHHPIFSAARSRDNKELREMWQPIFDKYRVDLVLTGHDHTYARSNLQTGVSTREGSAGTVYVVSVSGPKMYNLEREDWMQRAGENTQLCQIIRISGDTLLYEARTARGVLYDAFDLHKQDGKANQLVNKVPQTAERKKQ
jgi:hypothetical protein